MQSLNKNALRYHFATVIMPLLAIVSVGIMGASLVRASHALDGSGDIMVTPTIDTTKEYPGSADTSCCSLAVQNTQITGSTIRRVSVSVSLRNITKNVFQVSPGLQFSLIDSAGISHPYTAEFLPAGTSSGGPIAAGASESEALDFTLAPNDTPRYLSFQADGGSRQVLLGLPQ